MAELLELNKVDVVCLQETKRQNFTDKELSDFAVRSLFKWFCISRSLCGFCRWIVDRCEVG